MRSGTTAKTFVFPEGSAAPKGLLYDEILINHLVILMHLPYICKGCAIGAFEIDYLCSL